MIKVVIKVIVLRKSMALNRENIIMKRIINKTNFKKQMIKVTENAKTQALQLMRDDGNEGYFIRVAVKGGGCSGLMYELTFDNSLNENDKSFTDNGVEVVVDKKSFLYLVGTTLDFSGGLNGKGFVFSNPNADRTCGCGESFSL